MIEALSKILEDLASLKVQHRIHLRSHEGPGAAEFDIPSLEQSPQLIQAILNEESEVVSRFWLWGPGNHPALSIQRKGAEITDEVQVATDQNWYNQLNVDEERKQLLVVKLVSSARRHLRAVETDASLMGTADSEWGRYRASQNAILNSLQETQRTILSDFTRKSLEMEAASTARVEAREAELQKHYDILKEQLDRERITENERLAVREKDIEDREKRFNTKEARYVARSEQQKQIEQIQDWLKAWSLTKGTVSKRYLVICAYAIGAGVTGYFTYWFSTQSMAVIQTSAPQLAWWQWLLLAIKSIFPLAAFITIVAAFIRWSSDWAKQHADEEFRNRARVLDIGRTAWLLEAVRDAQDNGKELPAELVKELSRNLFAYSYSAADPAELHPQAVSDLLLQGLNSLRVKGPDGSEIEAKRGKG